MTSQNRSTLAQSVALLATFFAIAVVGIYALVTGEEWAVRTARGLIFVGAAILGLMEVTRGESSYELVGGGMLFIGSGYGVVLELLGTSGFSNTAVAVLVFFGIALTWLAPTMEGSDDDSGGE
ncbi:hypothetical protein [Natranaeroarchaeum aerophilus]|uniref:Uncharacterized protein n=1 Tax=Natranaeroarchaeum aerophilus TaxID=2917711 RepID=A0AAE3K5K5_9EURY|nr:hypothetical protein [Natranaeroarchaeum aerophilus]MCL9814108.1 hypothetical protein [Natranaeroarchaeum aerophilus]